MNIQDKAARMMTQIASSAHHQSSTSDKSKSLQESYARESSTSGNVLTTNWGLKLADDDNSLKAGPRGPVLLQDFHFREKMTHFDHERIPERVVHARGTAAHGYFQVYESQEEYTTATFLCDPSVKTPVFVRFSTVLGGKGSPDTTRDVRGFATRFYTRDGNFDLVGNNIPVFFIQDAIKFPDLVHSGKPEPHNEIPSQGSTAHDNFWDFCSLVPESTHMLLWVLSDRAIPRSYRMIEGFGVNTFVFVNKAGKRRFVKFHWRPKLGTHALTWDEAEKNCGRDPDFHRRDLWEAINTGNYPEYEFGVQLVDEEDEHKFDFDLLDDTKFIPEELVPIKFIGKMVLDGNVSDTFAETEQVAYCIQNLVAGIEMSNDPVLQGRAFSYLDTQLSRLGGPNFQEIPINRPMCPVFNNQRDGFHRETIGKGQFNYFPNRHGYPCPGKPTQPGVFHDAPHPISTCVKERMRGAKFNDHYSQALLFYNSLSAVEKEHLLAAAAFELGRVSDAGVHERIVNNFNHVHPELASKVALSLGMQPPPPLPEWRNHGKISKGLTISDPAKTGPVATFKIAFLIADGYDLDELNAARAAIKAAGCMTFIVGARKGALVSSSSKGETTETDFTVLTSKSTFFDALFIPGGAESIATLSGNGDALVFIHESFKHFKPIGAVGEAVQLLKSCILPGIQFASTAEDGVVSSQGVVTCIDSKSVLGNLATAASSLVGSSAAGALSGAMGAGGMAGAFLEALSHYRFWTRDVKRVPA